MNKKQIINVDDFYRFVLNRNGNTKDFYKIVEVPVEKAIKIYGETALVNAGILKAPEAK